MSAVDKLREARSVIDTRGWIQNHYGNSYDGFCLLGALNFVFEAESDPDVQELGMCRHFMTKIVRRHVGSDSLVPSIVGYNDNWVRTKGEALAFFDEAIALAADSEVR